jgi:hypothetical protein
VWPVTRMASSGEELVSRKTSASSNLSELGRRGSSPAIYDLNEGAELSLRVEAGCGDDTL